MLSIMTTTITAAQVPDLVDKISADIALVRAIYAPAKTKPELVKAAGRKASSDSDSGKVRAS